MTIDGFQVSPGTAHRFVAFGGGYGVRMNVPGSGEDHYLVGVYPTDRDADAAIAVLNRFKDNPETGSEIELVAEGETASALNAPAFRRADGGPLFDEDSDDFNRIPAAVGLPPGRHPLARTGLAASALADVLCGDELKARKSRRSGAITRGEVCKPVNVHGRWYACVNSADVKGRLTYHLCPMYAVADWPANQCGVGPEWNGKAGQVVDTPHGQMVMGDRAHVVIVEVTGADARGTVDEVKHGTRSDVPPVSVDRPAAPVVTLATDGVPLAPRAKDFAAYKAAYDGEWLFLFHHCGACELVWEDATTAARVLGRQPVTRLGDGGELVPVLGIDAAESEGVIKRLILAGHRVAVAERGQDKADRVDAEPVELTHGSSVQPADGTSKVQDDQAARGGACEAAGVVGTEAGDALAGAIPDAGAGGGEAGGVRGVGLVDLPAAPGDAGLGVAGGVGEVAAGAADRTGEVTASPTVRVTLSTRSIDDYRRFLRIKSLPRYRFTGHTAEVPREYADAIGLAVDAAAEVAYEPWPGLFDYQRDITRLAILKRKFAGFVKPGLGKTFIESEFARHALANLPANRCALIVTPLMVVPQMIEEIRRFYGDALPVEQVRAKDLDKWLASGTGRFGITNWEAMRDGIRPGRLGCLVLDESSMLKSFYGKWGQVAIDLGKGLPWKFAGTGTPAPNDRIEYANHAVFLDQFPTTNAFLARYFVNRGQTDNRWELKPHALAPFYRSLSHWSIFLDSPATYGWRDNCHTIPPVEVHIEDVEMSSDQWEAARAVTGDMFASHAGGIGQRAKLSRIAKGDGGRFANPKTAHIRRMVDSWPDESVIVWCYRNDEQDELEAAFPEAVSIAGKTK
jgi:hypothetical protein